MAAGNHPIKEMHDITLDHIIPVASGGGDDIDNLQLACLKHNHEKGAMLPEEWEEFQNT